MFIDIKMFSYLYHIMKGLIILIGFIYWFSSIFSSCYAQDCTWIKKIKGSNPNYDDRSTNLAVDPEGNIYIGGVFQSPMLYFQTDTLCCHGTNDIFIAKFDQHGNEIWIRQFGGNNGDYLETIGGLKYNPYDQSLIVCGSFFQNMTVGDTTIYGQILEAFVMKISLDGDVIWIRSGGGAGEDYAIDVTNDNGGIIYVTGVNHQSAEFGTQQIDAGGFLGKYSNHGDLIWIGKKFRIMCLPNCFSEVIVTNIQILNDTLFCLGYLKNDTIVIDTSIFIIPGQINPFQYRCSSIVTFSMDGNVHHIDYFGYPRSRYADKMCSHENKLKFSAGHFSKTCIFGSDTLHGANEADGYAIKHKANRAIDWIRQTWSSYFVYVNSVTTDPNGGVYLAGSFGGTTQFGDTTLTSIGVIDTYVMHYSAEGDFLGVKRFEDGDRLICGLDPQGNLVLTGTFRDTITSMGERDFFIAKCSPITGVPEPIIPGKTHLQIYANPTTGKCNITIPEEFLYEEELVLRIYDQMGKLVQEVKVANAEGTLRFDIRAQAKGLYHATLSNGRKVYSGKIVFE
ncbi:MAG: T9SS type A sorting domain-containing protein [Bacteroidetes bacterium]|nr:T9SS type A sorting domain-containing protein [Bacteroidota bacterium]